MSEWSKARLADVAEIRFSNVDKNTIPDEVPVRLCNYMDVYGNSGYITNDLPFMEASASTVEIERFRVEYGDVMLTKDSETPDDVGIPAVVVDEIQNLVCGYHLALIRPNPEQIDSVYLAKQLGSKATARYFSRLANGSTRYGLSSSSIACTSIPLAPLPQQRRIAEILSTLDEAIEETEALIAKYQQIKTGLMHDLFTRGVTPDGHLRPTRAQAHHLYKDSPLGWIPREWEIVRVKDLCRDIVDCPHSTPTYTTSGVSCIRTADMQPGVLLLDQAYRVSETEYIERVARLVPQEGDIIYSREGERLGIASPVGRERVCLGQRVMLMRPTCETNSDFLLWALNTPDFYRRILAGLGATTSPHINVGDIRKALLVQPSSVEQDQSGNLLARYSRLVRAEQIQLAKLKQVKHGLMQDLLTGRVRVKVAEAEEKL